MVTLTRLDQNRFSEAGRDAQPRRRGSLDRAPVLDERSLSMLIEGEIIPRLMIAHAEDRPQEAITTATVTADDVEAVAPLALAAGTEALLARVEEVLARGVSIDMVMVDLLAPAARLLGEWWEDDRCTFVDVTMGLWRLQGLVHDIAGRAPAARQRAIGGRRALFSAMPGDQHDFGTVVIDEVFHRDGWLTERPSGADRSELLRLIGSQWFDLVGLTVSCDCHVRSLAPLIAALRNVSRNPRLCVMVGGRVFVANPAIAMRVGADGTACDAKQALKLAADLVRAREGERLAV